jgi:hypothetical protein
MTYFPVAHGKAQWGYINPDTGDIEPSTISAMGIAHIGSFTIVPKSLGSPMAIQSNPAIDRLFSSEHFADLFTMGKAYDPQFEVFIQGRLEGDARWLAICSKPILLDNADWGFMGRLLSETEIEKIEAGGQ